MKDLESVDPELCERLMKMQEESVEGWGLTFAVDKHEVVRQDDEDVHELVPGGADMAVTDENKAEYIRLYAEYKVLGPSRHHHCAITAPSLRHRCTIAAPSLHHHCTITAPPSLTAPSLYKVLGAVEAEVAAFNRGFNALVPEVMYYSCYTIYYSRGTIY